MKGSNSTCRIHVNVHVINRFVSLSQQPFRIWYVSVRRGVSGNPTATWSWFELMDEVLGQRSTCPPVLIPLPVWDLQGQVQQWRRDRRPKKVKGGVSVRKEEKGRRGASGKTWGCRRKSRRRRRLWQMFQSAGGKRSKKRNHLYLIKSIFVSKTLVVINISIWKSHCGEFIVTLLFTPFIKSVDMDDVLQLRPGWTFVLGWWKVCGVSGCIWTSSVYRVSRAECRRVTEDYPWQDMIHSQSYY